MKRYYENRPQPRRPKKLTDWARQLITCLGRWTGRLGRLAYLVGDGSYATYELLDHGRRQGVDLIVRMRLNARLFHFPPRHRPAGKTGPDPKIGNRMLSMDKRLSDGRIRWTPIQVSQWYGSCEKTLLITHGRGLWYKSGEPLVPVRWVLIKDPQGKEKHALLALFSIICLLAKPLYEQGWIKPMGSAWYVKQHITFSDILTTVRLYIWQHNELLTTLKKGEVKNYVRLNPNILYLLARAAA